MSNLKEKLESKYHTERVVTYFAIALALLCLVVFVVNKVNKPQSNKTDSAGSMNDDGTYTYRGKLFTASLPCRATHLEDTITGSIDNISCFTEASGFWISSKKDFDQSEYTQKPDEGEDEDGTIFSNISQTETVVGDTKGLTTIYFADERNYETGGRSESKIISTKFIIDGILYKVTMMTVADSANDDSLKVYGRVIDSLRAKNDE